MKLTAPYRKKTKRYYRIYEKFQHLRFELEMRQGCLKNCRHSFFSYSFEEFEEELVEIFLGEFEDLCPGDSKYSFWLLNSLRRNSSLPKLKDLSSGMSKAIFSPYNLSFSEDLESAFNSLQLVSFLQKGDIQKDLSLANSINLAIVRFAIIDFLKFTGKNSRSTYYREKALSFFKNLLDLIKPLKIEIDEDKFVAFHFCHWVYLEKRNNTWFVELKIAANILASVYPYTLPQILLIYKKNSELAIKSQFIESFNTKNSWKEFEIEKTYKNISLSDLEIKKRHTNIINILKVLENEKEIESEIQISSNKEDKHSIEIKNLTPKIKKKNNKILFKESMKSSR